MRDYDNDDYTKWKFVDFHFTSPIFYFINLILLKYMTEIFYSSTELWYNVKVSNCYANIAFVSF